MENAMENESSPELEKLVEKVWQLSDCLRDIAQRCMNQSVRRQYNPNNGDLARLKNAFNMVDKRLKLAKIAANELSFMCTRPFDD